MKKAIITGATGAIGTALINELIKTNTQVLVLCRKESKRNTNIPDNPLVKKAYCSLEELNGFSIDSDEKYDVFFHLAWQGTTGKARNDMYLQNLNVKYSLDAVNLAKKLGCRKFIGVGSQAEYGFCTEKLTPHTPAFPESGYGIGKLCAGLMTKKLAHSLGIEHNWVRVVSVFGENDSENSLVMSLIKTLHEGKVPKLTKGEQIWNYLYSADAAEALRMIAEKGIDGKTYVLASSEEAVLSEYIYRIRDIINKNIDLDFGAIPYYENQAMYLSADISELTSDTGWYPKTSFDEGIAKTYKSFVNEPKEGI